MLLLSYWLPESPKWLLLQSPNALANLSDEGRSNQYFAKVHASITALRAPGHDVNKEIALILTEAKAEADNQANNDVTWAEVFSYKEGIVIGVGLLFFQVQSAVISFVLIS